MRPRIRTATLTGYDRLARSVGLEPAELAGAVGLTVEDLEVSDRWIPAAPAARLLELSAQRSGVPDFALRLAGLRSLGTLGPISVVLRDEPDLQAVLDLLTRYEAIYNEALHLRMSRDGELARVSTWLEFGEPTPSGQALDLVMAALIGIIRVAVGADWEPLAASFVHPAPADVEPYRRMFGPQLRFRGDVTGLVFPARDLDRPVTTADPSLRPYTQRFLQAIVAPGATTAAAQVAEVVELLLPLGRCSVEDASRNLGLSPRQLQRYLAAEHQTFSRVVHQVRARLAERYLEADRYTLTDLSQLLGFAAPSAFSRWFRQQFGISPSAWRTAADTGSAPAGVPAPRWAQSPDGTRDTATPAPTHATERAPSPRPRE